MSHNGSHKRHKNTSGVQLATASSKARWKFSHERGTTGDSQFKGEMGATKGTKTQKASRVQLAATRSKAIDDKVVLTFTSHATGWGGLSKN